MNHFVPAPTKQIITIADLDKLDIRVGMIESVEFVAGSDKLVKLTVEFGDRRRSVLAGLRNERADPKVELEGRQALFVVNLAPRKMAGQVSEAMLLDIGYADGITSSPLIVGSKYSTSTNEACSNVTTIPSRLVAILLLRNMSAITRSFLES